MKPMPDPIPVIRRVVQVTGVLALSSKKILRLVVPIIVVVAEVVQEIRRKK